MPALVMVVNVVDTVGDFWVKVETKYRYNIKICLSIPLLKLNVFDTLIQTVGTFLVLIDETRKSDSQSHRLSCRQFSDRDAHFRNLFHSGDVLTQKVFFELKVAEQYTMVKEDLKRVLLEMHYNWSAKRSAEKI